MSVAVPSAIPRPTLRWGLWAIVAAAPIAVGVVGFVVLAGRPGTPPEVATPPTPTESSPGGAVVRLAESKWAAAGVRVEPATAGPFSERIWRTGRLALDESRIAHLSPPVEGVVREVRVRLGQDVTAGQVLAVLDCREVGQAKLDLVKARLAAEYAAAQHGWAEAVARNAGELVEAVRAELPVAEVEARFKDRTIGELRQQLMTAYSRRLQAKAHYEAVRQADAQGATSQASVTRLRADYEAAEAAFRAVCEEVKFQTGQQLRAAAQKLREAKTAEALGKAGLLMLGYTQAEVDAMDPLAEGAGVSLYPVRAPFAGTLIAQHAVRSERVTPQHQLFQLADLSALWLQADVPQADLALARSLAGSRLRFRIPGGAQDLAADVFYTGDVIDPATRSVGLTATVANPDRGLKPGQFVEVELVRRGREAVQVPASAVQRQGTQAFVFVHTGGDEFRRADVTLGRESGGVVEVVGGLRPGQPVAVAGGFVLKSELFKDQMTGE